MTSLNLRAMLRRMAVLAPALAISPRRALAQPPRLQDSVRALVFDVFGTANA